MSQVLAPKPKLSNWHSGRQTSQRTFAQAPRHLSTKIGRDNLLQDDSKKATGTDFIPLQRVLSSKSFMYEAYTYTRLIADVKSDMLQYIFSGACTLNLTKVLGCCIGVLWLAHLLQANGGQMFTAKLCCKLRCTRQTNFASPFQHKEKFTAIPVHCNNPTIMGTSCYHLSLSL